MIVKILYFNSVSIVFEQNIKQPGDHVLSFFPGKLCAKLYFNIDL